MLSAAVVKFPDKNNLREKEFVPAHRRSAQSFTVGNNSIRSLRQLVTLHPQSRHRTVKCS